MAIVKPAGKWVWIIALQLVALVSISFAYGESSQDESNHSEEGGAVNVVLKEWFILPDKMSVDEGRGHFQGRQPRPHGSRVHYH